MTDESSLNICIVTCDIVGPVRNGGIGTWYHALATALAEAGHRVTILYTLYDYCESRTIDFWVEHYGAGNITFVPLPRYTQAYIDAALWVRVSFEVYQWLKREEALGNVFDVVHFHEWRGHGFYPTLARRQGLALRRSVLCVGTHSPLLWHKFGMGEYITDLEELQADHLERQSVAFADVVVSPSRYMLQWISEQGWRLPERVEVRQYIQAHALPVEVLSQPRHRQILELVLFGRLETRKGVALFCDAVDRMLASGELAPHPRPAVTFLGKIGHVEDTDARTYVQQRASSWQIEHSIIDNLDFAQAIDYLKQDGRLAVICSLLENSPNTVLECLVNQIPCICTDVGGNPELIHEEDRSAALFPPRANALAARFSEILRNGIDTPRPAIMPDQTRREWLDWHRQIVRDVPPVKPVLDHDPFISVCLTHKDRPLLLEQAIESLRKQDYSHFEVVLVDDGSHTPAADEYLRSLEGDFAERHWRIERQANAYLGAARNRAAQLAKGELLLFMDDDNVAKPNELATFAHAARYSNADILTCPLDGFQGEAPPVPDLPDTHRWLPLGGAINVGVFTNLVGDANAIIKRSAFNALGGFTEDYGVGHEDWELFAKAMLHDYDIQVVPEALFFYRVRAGSMLRTTSSFANHMRSIRPYLEAFGQLRTALEFTMSLFMLLTRRTADLSTLYDRVQATQAALDSKAAEAAAHAERATVVEQLAMQARHEAMQAGQRISEAEVARQEALRQVTEAQERARAAETRAIAAEARAAAAEASRIAAEAAAKEARAAGQASFMAVQERAQAAEAWASDAEQRGGNAQAETVAEVVHVASRLDAYTPFHGNGTASTYQREVDHYWNSYSWRLGAPLRNTMLRMRGLPPEQRPVVQTRQEADAAIRAICNSMSWEAASPLRLFGKTIRRLSGRK